MVGPYFQISSSSIRGDHFSLAAKGGKHDPACSCVLITGAIFHCPQGYFSPHLLRQDKPQKTSLKERKQGLPLLANQERDSNASLSVALCIFLPICPPETARFQHRERPQVGTPAADPQMKLTPASCCCSAPGPPR